MAGGILRKLLTINLSTGKLREETADESLYTEFIGGYGIGARILYSRQRGGVDPLGPENIFGLVTGPLTGTPAPMGNRYTAVAKSPLTDGWGDANSGGYFGPYLKFAGYDGVFFTGVSSRPVYVLLDNGKAEIRDASYLWGKDTYETEDMLRSELGKGTEIACIGPSGEKLSRISSIITRRGAAAGRSGLGAVMGSKMLKAVAARGTREILLADREEVDKIRREYMTELKERQVRGKSFISQFRKYGTSNGTELQAHSGDTPVKNWGGVGILDFPDSSGLSGEAAIANLEKRSGCWHCPIGCEGQLYEGKGEYGYPTGTRRPEYETLAAFGTMCLNNNTESIAMANHLCNSYGLDTISAGCSIAFAIECYENGLITKADTDGIELTWGNHRSIVAMTKKIARREGFGDILADGVRIAAEKIGRGAKEYAVHIGGQELGMHDPKFEMPYRPGFRIGQPPAARYQMDATPGRHTQGFGPPGFLHHIFNVTGVCLVGYSGLSDSGKYIARFMEAITGWEWSAEKLLADAERILNMRHAFNLREGIKPLQWRVHPRITGNPPQKAGPLADVTVDIGAQIYSNLEALDWDPETTKPSKKKLLELGLDDVAIDLWP